nr:diguanylate cyclase/phosphodiesterase [uncultured bacterium]
MNEPFRILYLEDEPSDRQLVAGALRRDGLACEFVYAATEHEFREALNQSPCDLILSDFTLPAFSGATALILARAAQPEVPFLFVSGTIGEERAVKSLKDGATDYVLKHNLTRLGPAVRRALSEAAERRQRLHAEQALQLQTTALEAAANGILITARDGTILTANPAFCAMTGYASDEVIGRKPSLLKSGQHEPKVYEQMWQTICAGDVWQGELVNRRKDGSLYHEEMTITPVRAAGGDISHFIAVKQDVSRKKAEQRAVTLFRTLIDRTNDAIEVIDPETGRILDVNERACQSHGYTREEYLALRLPDLVPAMAAQPWAEIREELQRAGSRVIESHHWRKDGSVFPIEVNVTHIHLDRDYLLAVVRDISERKQAEETLRWRTAFFEALAESELDGIVVVDREGKIIYQNRRSIDLWKIPETIVAAADDTKQVQHAASRTKHPQAFIDKVAYLSAHNDESSREEIELNDGTVLDRYSSPVVGKNGDYYGRIWTFRDITEHKRLEAQLRQAVKMEAVGQLAGGVAHDFNNILATVMMHLGLLQQSPGLTADARESLKELETEATRAAGLARQLLLFSRREVAHPKPLDLNELVQNLLKMLRRLLGENMDIVFRPSSDAVWLAADAGMIEQVVMNLCVNARDAMPNGGQLDLAISLIELRSGPPRPNSSARSFACLSVNDSGCGMDAAVLQRIFEPFFTTKEAGKGTGLGLATVYGIVKQHQGWIEVDSEEGKGSSFRIFLPALKEAMEKPKAAVTEHPDEAPRGSETILLVEDDESVRRMAALCLRKLGYEVLETASGVEALESWRKHRQRIKLLFTDLIMPGTMTGLGLAQRLRQERPDLKVIISSGYDSERTAPSSIVNQPFTHCAKPYSTFALAKIVRQCLDEPTN